MRNENGFRYFAQEATTLMTAKMSPTALEFGEHAPGQAPLASWNEGPTKQSIVDFVCGVTTAGGDQFVEPEERIASRLIGPMAFTKITSRSWVVVIANPRALQSSWWLD